MTDATVRLVFPARADYLLLARLALSGIARTLAMDEEVVADLKLAVTEACGNAVRHAYGPDGGPVSVEFLLRGSTLEVVVEDAGSGITLPDQLEDEPSEREVHLPPEGGMGMPIIRAIVDDLEIGAGSGGRGTAVRMVKVLSPSD